VYLQVGTACLQLVHCCVQVGTVLTVLPSEGLYPAVGMHSDGEEVRLSLDAEWQYSGVTLMSIDSCEEDWWRLHDVRVNGQVTTHCLVVDFEITQHKFI